MGDQVTVTRLNVYHWLIDWKLKQWPRDFAEWEGKGTLRFECGGTIFEIRLAYVFSFISCVLETTNAEYFREKAPHKVLAIIDGIMVKLRRLPTYYYGRVRSQNLAGTSTAEKETPAKDDAAHELPSVQLILEFRDGFPTPERRTGPKQILESFSKLFETGSLADIVFIVQGQIINAHTAIVAAGSPVFSAIFHEDDFKGAHVRTVTVEDIEAKVFQEMLRYLYTGVVHFNEMTESLYLAAEKYQIDSLKSECENYLHMNLTVENAVRRLILGHLYSSSNLLEGAVQFIVGNKEEIWMRSEWKELVKNYPDLFLNVTQKMVIGQ